MGKTKDLTPQKIAGVKMLINTGSFSDQEICQTLEISESSVRWIKKKINLGEELCPHNLIKQYLLHYSSGVLLIKSYLLHYSSAPLLCLFSS